VAVLEVRRQEQDTNGEHCGDGWVETSLVSSATGEAFRKLADQLGSWGHCCTLLLHRQKKEAGSRIGIGL
jgi:hypothetical protein